MSPPPRSLTFVVSTSLLTASLSLAGCDEPKQANPPTDKGADKNVGKAVETVNEGPEKPPQPETPPPPETPPQPEPSPEPINVNEGPEPMPEPPPEKVNPGPEVVPQAAPEPKNVNTRPEP